MKVLVVDDAAINRLMMERLLQADGHTVVTASFGAEALQRLADHRDIEAVICDLIMPDIDGVEVYRQYLRRSLKAGHQPTVPFLLMTAAEDVGRLKDARDLGFAEILSKPPDYECIKQVLADIKAQRRPHRRGRLTNAADANLWP